MEAMSQWWEGLSVALKFFYAIAFGSTAVMLVQTAMTVLGAGDHDSPDVGPDHDMGADHGDGDFKLLSVRTVIAFLVGFGWAGAVMLDLGWAMVIVAPIALAVGILMMAGVFWVMKMLWSLRESGTIDFVNAIGEVGTVYLPIPPDKERPGQVEVMIQGRLMVVEAYTNAEDRLENQARVRVIDTVGSNALLVEPMG